MPGGPIFPHSAYPHAPSAGAAGTAYPVFFYQAGITNETLQHQGLGVAASLVSEVYWELRFLMPPTLPTGTGKVRLYALSHANTGDAKVHVKWASVAIGEDPSTATLNGEGVSTLAWVSEDDDYRQIEITLDADTLVAGEMVVLNLEFQSESWTLAAPSWWLAAIIWE